MSTPNDKVPAGRYEVRWDERLLRWTCTCLDWHYRHGQPWDQYQCKHIRAHLQEAPHETPPMDR